MSTMASGYGIVAVKTMEGTEWAHLGSAITMSVGSAARLLALVEVAPDNRPVGISSQAPRRLALSVPRGFMMRHLEADWRGRLARGMLAEKHHSGDREGARADGPGNQGDGSIGGMR